MNKEMLHKTCLYIVNAARLYDWVSPKSYMRITFQQAPRKGCLAIDGTVLFFGLFIGATFLSGIAFSWGEQVWWGQMSTAQDF